MSLLDALAAHLDAAHLDAAHLDAAHLALLTCPKCGAHTLGPRPVKCWVCEPKAREHVASAREQE